MKHQRGQTTVFFALILTGLLLLTAVGIEIGRIVYARGGGRQGGGRSCARGSIKD